MKKITFILLFLSCLFSYAQDRVYKAKAVYQALGCGGGQPLGKNATIKYDDFFKTYTISFTDSEGRKDTKQFYPCNGCALPNTHYKSETNYYLKVTNEIKTKGQLCIKIALKDGWQSTYTFQNVSILK